MLGSLSVYRRELNDRFFNPRQLGREQAKLPVVGHALAGMMAGWTVSFIAAPVEHIKARLQIRTQQIRVNVYTADRSIACKKYSVDMACAGCIMVSQQRSSSAHSSASGGGRTMSSQECCRTTQTCPRRQSTSGQVDYRRRSSGLHRTQAMW